MWGNVFLILVLAVSLDGTYYLAKIQECDSLHELIDMSLVIPMDENLFLCCNSTDTSTCSTKNQSYSLIIEPQANCNVLNSSLLWSDTCSAKAEFFAKSNEQKCEYICRDVLTSAQKPFARLLVITSYPPPLQKLVQIKTSCTGEFNVTVSQPLSYSTQLIKNTYGISLSLSNGTRILLYFDVCKTEINTNTCLFAMDIGSLLGTDDVDFILNVSNPVGSGIYNETINLLSYIVPDCVEELSLFHESLTSSEAVIKFLPPRAMLHLIPYMSSLGEPLLYHISLIKTSGVAEKIQFYINKTVFNETDTYGNQYMAVKFQHLKAYMNYTVTVTGRAGGGDGCTSMFTFTTKKAAPANSPYLVNFSFSRPTKSVNSSLMLIWKPLSIDEAGGSDISYDVEITSVYGYFLRLSRVQHAYLVALSDLPCMELFLKVWSRNEIGASENFTQMKIPHINSAVIDDTKLLIDYINTTTAVAFFDLPKEPLIQQIVFHWCHDYFTSVTSNQTVCLDYPQSLFVNSSPDFLKTNNVTISLASNTDKKEVINTEVLIDYYDFENESQPLINKKTARAIKTVSRSADLNVQVQQPASSKCQNKAGDYPRFFISLKSNNSWSGLIAAECHFTRQSKNGLFSYTLYNQSLLSITQQCDTCNPSHFLIRSYKISLAQVADCQEKLGGWFVDSSIYGKTFIQIPSNVTSICIYAVRENSWTDQDPALVDLTQHTEASQESSFSSVLIPVSVVAVLTVIGVLAFCMIPKCKERKKHFQQMMVSDISANEKNVPSSEHFSASQLEMSSVYKNTESKRNSNLSSVDSGHPTNSGSDLDYMVQNSTGQDVSTEGSSSKFSSFGSGSKTSSSGSGSKTSSSGSGSKTSSSGSGSKTSSSGSGSKTSSSGSGSKTSSSGGGSKTSCSGSGSKASSSGSGSKTSSSGSGSNASSSGSESEASNSTSGFEASNSGSAFEVSNSGSGFEASNSRSAFEASSSGCGFEASSSGCGFEESSSRCGFLASSSSSTDSGHSVQNSELSDNYNFISTDRVTFSPPSPDSSFNDSC